MASVNVHKVLISVKQIGAKTTTRQLQGVTLALAAIGFSAAAMGRAMATASDEVVRLENKTKIFADTQESANTRLNATVAIARETNSSLKSVADVMQRVSLAGTGMGLDDDTIVTITENLAKAVKLSGATAQEAEGALRQFSQGLAANRLSGQELNSVLEQTPLIAKLLADSMKVSTGALRQLGKDGEITADVLVKAFGSTIPTLEEMFARFDFPIEDLLVSVRRETTLLLATVSDVTGFADTVRTLLKGLTLAIYNYNETLKESPEATRNLKEALGAAGGAIVGITSVLLGMGAALAVATGGWSLLVPAIAALAGGVGGGLLGGALAKGAETAAGKVERLREQIERNSKVLDQSAGVWGAYREAQEKIVNGDLRKQLAEATKDLEKYNGAIKSLEAIGLPGDRDIQPKVAEPKFSQATIDGLEDLSEGYRKLLDLYDEGGARLREYNDNLTIADAAYQLYIATEKKAGVSKEEYAKITKGLEEQLHSETEAQVASREAAADAADAFASLRGSLFETVEIQQEYAENLAIIRDQERLVSGATEETTAAYKELNKQRDLALGLDEANRIQDIKDSYEDLTAALSPLTAATQEWEEGFRILNERMSLGTLSSAEYSQQLQLLNERFDEVFGPESLQGVFSLQTAISGVQQGFIEWGDTIGTVGTAMSDVTQGALTIMTDAFTEFFTTGELGIKSFGRSMLQMIQQIITQLLVQLAIQTAISAIGGFGGIAGSASQVPASSGLLSSLNTGGGAAFIAGRAAGGPVRQGVPVLTGERGPELFVPPRSGSMESAASLASGRSQAPIINITNVDDPNSVIDAMGTQEGEQAILNVINRNPDVLRQLQ